MRRAWLLVRLELAIAFVAPLVVGLGYLAAPGNMGEGLGPAPSPSLFEFVPWAGVVGLIVGLVWIVRLSRSDPDAGEPEWRYRDF
jgi:hypothetical protein